MEEGNREEIEQFEGELPELKRIIKNEERNVIDERKIEEIRGNLAVEAEVGEKGWGGEVEYEEIEIEGGG